jgi:RND family efflux transporter MFP subunit
MDKPVQTVLIGFAESPKSVPITADFSGSIDELYVKEGQPVKAGQPLFKIQGFSEHYATDSVAASVPMNESSEANPEAQANYDSALKEYNRYQKLYEQGAIARKQVENAAAHLQAAQNGLTNPPQTSETPLTNSTVTAASNSVTTITAPVDGTVSGLTAAASKAVQAGQQLMILDAGEVQVVTHLEQNDLALIHSGTPVSIEVSGQTMSGQVSGIYPDTVTNDVPSFRTHISVTDNTAGLLKAGMSVNVSINTGRSTPVQAVPLVAILHDEQGLNYIYLMDHGNAIRQPITIGEAIGNFMEITSDLPEQATVVTSNMDTIKGENAYSVPCEIDQ